jgi:NAD(P)-dependent dehydrogenase (short-subunit alcohol dehydrogenase family)
MPRILVTGSTQGLGRAAAVALLEGGDEVVLHVATGQEAPAWAISQTGSENRRNDPWRDGVPGSARSYCGQAKGGAARTDARPAAPGAVGNPIARGSPDLAR